MGKVSRERVVVHNNYRQNTRNIRVYSVLYPESNFGGFSGMVPEWFQKRSIYRLRIY